MKKVVRKGSKAVKKKRGAPKAMPARRKKETLNIPLPEKPSAIERRLEKYITLVYGREKWGKTTLFSTYPDTLFLMFEPGAKGIEIFDFNHDAGGVTSWEIAKEALRQLEATKKRFRNVCIDTTDRAYDMCLDFVCKERGIDYPGQDEFGKEDFGKSWRAVRQEFTDFVQRIIRTGRGVCLTSHVREAEIEAVDGKKYTRVYPSMGKQARTTVEALVDFFFYGEYVKGPGNKVLRVLVTEGDETVWAGHRKIEGSDFPRFLPVLEPDEGYETIKAAFDGEHPGIDVEAIRAGALTGKAFKEMLDKAKLQAVAEKRKAKKKGGKKIRRRS